MQKSGLAGRVSLWLANGGAYSGILLEIGSSLVVDRHQIKNLPQGGFLFVKFFTPYNEECRYTVVRMEGHYGSF